MGIDRLLTGVCVALAGIQVTILVVCVAALAGCVAPDQHVESVPDGAGSSTPSPPGDVQQAAGQIAIPVSAEPQTELAALRATITKIDARN